MLIRVFRAKARPGKQAELKKCLELLALPNMHYRSGMLAFYPGQTSGRNDREFVLVTVWREGAASQAQSGSEWAKAIIPPEALPLLEDFQVHSYQAFGVKEPAGQPLFTAI